MCSSLECPGDALQASSVFSIINVFPRTNVFPIINAFLT